VSTPALSRRRLLARGIAWNAWYHLFVTALALGAMMILVRIIPPAEYGRFGAAIGLLALLNSFNFVGFVAQALQLPDGQEPDWSLHWSAGFYIQMSLMLACNGLAGLCWLAPDYRAIAPLLHLAAFGLVLDWPAQLWAAMLRREMNFRRLKVLHACSTTLNLLVTIIAGLAGGGAYAIVLGGNVITPLPLAVDLLLVHRWRPRPGWWGWPDWPLYRPALRFGLQQSGSALLGGARGALESVVLPGAVGFVPMGLLNRSRALFTSTIGRAGQVLVETAYPLLPRYVSDLKLYARHAALFWQILMLVLLPGALYLGLEGPALSRLLYGERWIGADPLFWPGTLAGLGLGLFVAGSSVLLAASRLRSCLLLDALAAGLSVPVIAVAWAGGGILAYAWAVAAGQLAVGTIALALASSRLAVRWVRSALVPPAVGSLLAIGAVLIVERTGVISALIPRLCLATFLYALTLAVSLRGLFPVPLAALLSGVPGGGRVSGWLRLPVTPSVSAAPKHTN
jgi:O-antigen/teichoic acid export membrane protein